MTECYRHLIQFTHPLGGDASSGENMSFYYDEYSKAYYKVYPHEETFYLKRLLPGDEEHYSSPCERFINRQMRLMKMGYTKQKSI